jgi:hypothetical protein
MKKLFAVCISLIFLFVSGALFAAAQPEKEQRKTLKEYMELQRKEMSEYKRSLKNLPTAEKKKKLEEKREKMYLDNGKFNEAFHKQNIEALRKRLEQTGKYSSLQMDSMIKDYDKQFMDRVAFNEEQRRKEKEFMAGLESDKGLSKNEKNRLISKFRAEHKARSKEFRKKQVEEKLKNRPEKMRNNNNNVRKKKKFILF